MQESYESVLISVCLRGEFYYPSYKLEELRSYQDCSHLEDLIKLKTIDEGLKKLEALDTEISRHWTTVSGDRYICQFKEAQLAIDHIAAIQAAQMDTWVVCSIEEHLY